MKTSLTILFAVLLLSGCGNTIKGHGIAEPEVQRFHELLKAKDFDAMYEQASAEFKSASPKDKVVALFAAIDRKLGPLQKTEQVRWNVNTSNLKTFVVLVYASKFQDGEATETFTYRIEDEHATMVGYNISSLDMLIK